MRDEESPAENLPSSLTALPSSARPGTTGSFHGEFDAEAGTTEIRVLNPDPPSMRLNRHSGEVESNAARIAMPACVISFGPGPHLEDLVPKLRRNTGPIIFHSDEKRRGRPSPGAYSERPTGSVFQAVIGQVLDDAPEKLRVGRHRQLVQHLEFQVGLCANHPSSQSFRGVVE